MSSERICSACGHTVAIGEYPWCPHGIPYGGHRLTAIHPSERSVIYRNPKTGETRYPPRADQPMPRVYASQGYERVELRTPLDVSRFEKETGRIHERSHYDPGSGRAEREMSAEPETPKHDEALTRRLVEAIS